MLTGWAFRFPFVSDYLFIRAIPVCPVPFYLYFYMEWWIVNICGSNLLVGQVINRRQGYFISSRPDFLMLFLRCLTGNSEDGRIYNPLRTVKEKNSRSQRKCRSLYGYWNVTPLQHATNSIKEGLPKFYFRPGYRSNFPYPRHQGGPRQISVLHKRPWYIKKRRCKFFSLRVTSWLRIVNPLEKGVPMRWFDSWIEGERWMPVLTILWRNSFVPLQGFDSGMHGGQCQILW